MEWAKPSAADVLVTDEWTVTLPSLEDRVVYNAAKDLVDYFAVSMGVFVKLTPSKEGEKQIRCVCVYVNNDDAAEE